MTKIQITMSEGLAFQLYNFARDNGFWQSPITDIAQLLSGIFGLEGMEKLNLAELKYMGLKIERIKE